MIRPKGMSYGCVLMQPETPRIVSLESRSYLNRSVAYSPGWRADHAGTDHSLVPADGGVERAYRQIGFGDDFSYFVVEIIRVTAFVNRGLHAARRYDDASE